VNAVKIIIMYKKPKHLKKVGKVKYHNINQPNYFCKTKPQEIKIPDFTYCPILGIRYYLRTYYI
jgi:hypothetical protein